MLGTATIGLYFWSMGGGAAARSGHAWIRQCHQQTTINTCTYHMVTEL